MHLGLKAPIGNHYQSSSSSRGLPCILACLALNASARPPARLGALPLSGVALPSLELLMLTALSLGPGGGGANFRPDAAGLFAGGIGGFGLALPPAGVGTGRAEPFATTGGGTGRDAIGAEGSSFRYAMGAQPSPPVSFLASHHPKQQSVW